MMVLENNKDKGKKGESIGAQYLKKKGYLILEMNYRVRRGEIDIIAKKGDYVVFVEVKLRKNISHGMPKEAVDSRKQRQIISVAQEYIVKKKLFNKDFRFDVIEIIDGDSVFINHIENAFWLS